ncbi:hypothetical protein CBOM_06303 [Ceraceosorus bombacis]|uniref:Uncharacterized protein n=1 Tax=Ceraceosorus bombacis TaxID=401625 RepID=A0A0P1BRG6_9BASI|nr:hypothetical protein CBOM_06303 [Ceraceosorus bombacis]
MSNALHIDYGYEGSVWLVPELVRKDSQHVRSSPDHTRSKRRRTSRHFASDAGNADGAASMRTNEPDSDDGSGSGCSSASKSHSKSDSSSEYSAGMSSSESRNMFHRAHPLDVHPTRSSFRFARRWASEEGDAPDRKSSSARRLSARTYPLCLLPSIPASSTTHCLSGNALLNDPAVSLVPYDLIKQCSAPHLRQDDQAEQTRGVCLVRAPLGSHERKKIVFGEEVDCDWLICSVGAEARELYISTLRSPARSSSSKRSSHIPPRLPSYVSPHPILSLETCASPPLLSQTDNKGPSLAIRTRLGCLFVSIVKPTRQEREVGCAEWVLFRTAFVSSQSASASASENGYVSRMKNASRSLANLGLGLGLDTQQHFMDYALGTRSVVDRPLLIYSRYNVVDVQFHPSVKEKALLVDERGDVGLLKLGDAASLRRPKRPDVSLDFTSRVDAPPRHSGNPEIRSDRSPSRSRSRSHSTLPRRTPWSSVRRKDETWYRVCWKSESSSISSAADLSTLRSGDEADDEERGADEEDEQRLEEEPAPEHRRVIEDQAIVASRYEIESVDWRSPTRTLLATAQPQHLVVRPEQFTSVLAESDRPVLWASTTQSVRLYDTRRSDVALLDWAHHRGEDASLTLGAMPDQRRGGISAVLSSQRDRYLQVYDAREEKVPGASSDDWVRASTTGMPTFLESCLTPAEARSPYVPLFVRTSTLGKPWTQQDDARVQLVDLEEDENANVHGKRLEEGNSFADSAGSVLCVQLDRDGAVYARGYSEDLPDDTASEARIGPGSNSRSRSGDSHPQEEDGLSACEISGSDKKSEGDSAASPQAFEKDLLALTSNTYLKLPIDLQDGVTRSRISDRREGGLPSGTSTPIYDFSPLFRGLLDEAQSKAAREANKTYPIGTRKLWKPNSGATFERLQRACTILQDLPLDAGMVTMAEVYSRTTRLDMEKDASVEAVFMRDESSLDPSALNAAILLRPDHGQSSRGAPITSRHAQLRLFASRQKLASFFNAFERDLWTCTSMPSLLGHLFCPEMRMVEEKKRAKERKRVREHEEYLRERSGSGSRSRSRSVSLHASGPSSHDQTSFDLIQHINQVADEIALRRHVDGHVKGVDAVSQSVRTSAAQVALDLWAASQVGSSKRVQVPLPHDVQEELQQQQRQREDEAGQARALGGRPSLVQSIEEMMSRMEHEQADSTQMREQGGDLQALAQATQTGQAHGNEPTEPPPVRFAFLTPRVSSIRAAQGGGTTTLTARLLLQDWEVGTHPAEYEWRNPYASIDGEEETDAEAGLSSGTEFVASSRRRSAAPSASMAPTDWDRVPFRPDAIGPRSSLGTLSRRVPAALSQSQVHARSEKLAQSAPYSSTQPLPASSGWSAKLPPVLSARASSGVAAAPSPRQTPSLPQTQSQVPGVSQPRIASQTPKPFGSQRLGSQKPKGRRSGF